MMEATKTVSSETATATPAYAEIGMQAVVMGSRDGVICGLLPEACIVRDEDGNEHVVPWSDILLDNVRPATERPKHHMLFGPKFTAALLRARDFVKAEADRDRLAGHYDLDDTPDPFALEARRAAVDDLLAAIRDELVKD